jgi:hypothetical protein
MNATIVGEQAATVVRLNGIPDKLRIPCIVDAGPLPTVATEKCADDSAHGWGTCYAPDLDGACPDCAINYLRWVLVAGAHVALDVLQTPTDQKA